MEKGKTFESREEYSHQVPRSHCMYVTIGMMLLALFQIESYAVVTRVHILIFCECD